MSAAGWRAVAVAAVGAPLLATWVVLAPQVALTAESSGWYVAAASVPCLLVALLLVARLPGAAVTRLVTTMTLCHLVLLAGEAARRWRAGHGGPAYDHLEASLAPDSLAWVGTLPLLPLLLVAFPDGVPRHGVWRAVWTAQVVAVSVLLVVSAVQVAGIDPGWVPVPAVAAGALLVSSGIGRGAWLVGSWWRARGQRRRQLLPFVVVAGALAVFYAVGAARLLATGTTGSATGVAGGLVFAGTIGGLPVAVGLSVLRHRLFGIEVTLNRVAVASTLAVMLFGVYTATAVAAAAVTAPGGRPVAREWGSLLAAAATVAAVSPLYRLTRAGVDRAMFGERDRPDRALRDLAGRLGETVDPLEVPDVVVDTVARTLRLPFVALDRDTATGPVRAARHGEEPTPRGRVVEFPIDCAGQRLAVLLVAPRAGETRLGGADRTVLADLAGQAGPALYSGRLANELADSRERLQQGRLEERARLRRALHDGLSPSLSGIAIAAAAAHGRPAGDPSVRLLLARIEQEAGAGAATLRALLAGLRPPGLDELGLAVAVETRARELAESTGLGFAVVLDDPLPALEPEVEQTAYLLAVEAMVNVVRHARASRCQVRLTNDGDALGVHVSDDGRGLPGTLPDGDGLRSARERVAACGGALTFTSASAGGARLHARLPAWAGR